MSARRILGVAATLAVVLAGLVVHFIAPDGHASDIAGDALYAVAVWSALVALMPRQPSLLVGAIALVWCVGVELFQLTGLPAQWGAAFTPMMLVFGTVFDPRDLIVYAVMVVAVTALDVLLRAWVGGRRPPAAAQ